MYIQQKLPGHQSMLKPTTVLTRRPDLDIRLDSFNRVHIGAAGQRVRSGAHSLAVLDVFARPLSVQEALARLCPGNRQDWIDVSSTIFHLYQAGALVDPAQAAFTPDAYGGFGTAYGHIALLNDRQRTASFLRAIQEVVRPGDVVVDIGTGTGVLAVAAARAGAAQVYAIEAGAMADVAQAVFALNAVSERITLLRDWSTRVELPQRADVLISEIIGSDPFVERVLPVLHDARQRFLKPEARFLPASLKVWGLPVTLPPGRLAEHMVMPEALASWNDWYGIDFTPLLRMPPPTTKPLRNFKTQDTASWPRLSAPLLLAEVDFATFQDTTVERVVTAPVTQAGYVNGLALFFELQLGSHVLSTRPGLRETGSSWATPVWYLGATRLVQPGESVTIQYRYGVQGNTSDVRLIAVES